LALGVRPAYLATARAGDAEMAARIDAHKTRRGGAFATIEEPLDLVGALTEAGPAHDLVLVDCITLWLSNLMAADADPEPAVERLAAWMAAHQTPRLVIVSNEVGLGIVPDNALARRFRDVAGAAHQRLAEECGSVVFMVAGLPMAVKGPLPL
jgi:adenosylcobinamide kinase/adenosylcobinamide-phosphate guanylyltransferase